MRIEWQTGNPPDEDEECLVTLDTGSMTVCHWTTNYHLSQVGIKEYYWINRPQFCKIIAWMPLPNPYVPENEGGVL